jgi:hypothetical protein
MATEKGVAPDSPLETFAALQLEIDSVSIAVNRTPIAKTKAAADAQTLSNHVCTAGPFLFYDLTAIESSKPAFVRSSLGKRGRSQRTANK